MQTSRGGGGGPRGISSTSTTATGRDARLRSTRAQVVSLSSIPPAGPIEDGFGVIGGAPAALLVPSPTVVVADAGTSADMVARHISSTPGPPSSCSAPPGDVGPASRTSTNGREDAPGMHTSSKARVAAPIPARPSSLVGTTVPVLPLLPVTFEGCRTSDDSALRQTQNCLSKSYPVYTYFDK
jgi:hypothetical protein